LFRTPVYLDNHATTRVDPRVVEAMLPVFTESFGNAGSTTHAYGWDAKSLVDEARQSVASAIGASPKEILFTSGATESNNLAIRGIATRLAGKGRHLVSVSTEHPSVLDPLGRLAQSQFDVTLLPVEAGDGDQAGRLDPAAVEAALRPDTILVSVMLANNEIGAIHPLAEIAEVCRRHNVLLHTDATQAVGKIPLTVEALGIDLLSFSGHKIYGPKGIGALYIRRRRPPIRLEPILFGGGQELGMRSGTLNVPGIVGLAKALELCVAEMETETPRLTSLRDRLFRGLQESIGDVRLNGPALRSDLRLPGNLNVSFPGVDGQALLLHAKDLAVSSGSACTSENPEPSHVLRALALDEDATRAAVRFGLGRFNTAEEVDFAVTTLHAAIERLRTFRVT